MSEDFNVAVVDDEETAMGPATETEVDEELAIATPRQLMVRRFRKHKLAMFSVWVLIAMYIAAAFADFISPYNPGRTLASDNLEFNRSAIFVPPQIPGFTDASGGFTLRPHVYGLRQQLDPETLRVTYLRDRSLAVPLSLFVSGDSYTMWGLFETDIHLFGINEEAHPEAFYFPLGSDRLGRDMFSRIIHGSRISLSIGMISVFASLFLGVLLGGISGYFGGWVDGAVQRTIEFLISIPSIPLWMGLSAALPPELSQVTRYFLLTLILSLIGWTELARVVRGRFLSLRDEDFVTAAKFGGAGQMRIILRHMTPSFASHIIAALTLAIPTVILAETALSFLGLGLRAPTISWGVLLQEAQNIRTVALAPWLLLPGLAVVIAVLAFNFLGDGLRDAADPYAN